MGTRAASSRPEPLSLLGVGKWLALNGEAVYGTSPWSTYGEGPTKMEKAGAFCEGQDLQFTGKDVRFTAKDNVLYATCLGWPGSQITIQSLAQLYESEIQSVKMLGVKQDLEWGLGPNGLSIKTPAHKPCEHAVVFKIERRADVNL